MIKATTKLSKEEMSKTHYVYRITNIKLNKYYYGSRCATNKKGNFLQEDLEKYQSSSTDKEFKRDQKENPQDYKYKIIRIFTSNKRVFFNKPNLKKMNFSLQGTISLIFCNTITENILQVLNLEILLHNKFNVGTNPNFYNRAKQTSKGFSVAGKVTVKDSKENYYSVSKDDPRVLSGELVFINKDRVHTKEARLNIANGKNNMPSTIKSEIARAGGNAGKNKINVVDKDGNFTKVSKDDPRYLSGELVSWMIGKKMSNKCKLKHSNNQKGKNNSCALKIAIYDNLNNLIDIAHGNFKEVCTKNNLPFSLFKRSYQSNNPINFTTKRSITENTKLGRLKFKGWRAIKI